MDNEPIQTDGSTVHGAASRIVKMLDEDLSIKDDSPSEQETEPTAEAQSEPEPNYPKVDPEEKAEPEKEAEPEEATQETAEPIESEPIEDESTDVTRFEELSDHLNVDKDYLLSLTVDAKVNGKVQETSIKELISKYQKFNAADEKLAGIAEQRKVLESELESAKESIQSEWNEANNIKSVLEQLLSEEDPEMQKLRYDSPDEYSARLLDKQDKVKRLQEAQTRINQEMSKKYVSDYQAQVAKERTALLAAIPEWNDDNTAEVENSKLRAYLLSSGLQDWEIDGKIEDGKIVHPGIVDHRAVVLARKAMFYDESLKASKPKLERLKAVPKVGAGKPKAKDDLKAEARKKQRSKLRQSGRLDDAALVIRKQLFGE